MEKKGKKLAYTAPEVKPLGTVKDLTQGPWGGVFDTYFGGDGGWNPHRPHPGGS